MPREAATASTRPCAEWEEHLQTAGQEAKPAPAPPSGPPTQEPGTFDARAGAGLTRGWTLIAIGFTGALVFRLAMTHYYDRKGLHGLVAKEA